MSYKGALEKLSNSYGEETSEILMAVEKNEVQE